MKPGQRDFFLHDFSADERQPCDPTVEGWATWLSNPDGGYEPAEDGNIYEGSAIVWAKDIVASRSSCASWTLSRVPGDKDFVAVRFGEGLGWYPDMIISPELGRLADGSFGAKETMAEAATAWLRDHNEICEDTEFLAVGVVEEGWRFTYRADPPRLEVVRAH